MAVIQLIIFCVCAFCGILFIAEARSRYGDRSDWAYAAVWLAAGILVVAL